MKRVILPSRVGSISKILLEVLSCQPKNAEQCACQSSLSVCLNVLFKTRISHTARAKNARGLVLSCTGLRYFALQNLNILSKGLPDMSICRNSPIDMHEGGPECLHQSMDELYPRIPQ